VLRRTQPDAERPFRVPLYPVIPVLSVAACLYLIQGLPLSTFLLFAGWLAIALVAYFLYGLRHSRLAAEPGPDLSVGRTP
jgi:APA family basic amino acid/polyamine antiporter